MKDSLSLQTLSGVKSFFGVIELTLLVCTRSISSLTDCRPTFSDCTSPSRTIGPLHDPVTWYKITYTGEQIAQWDFQNKGRCIVLEVPLRNLLTSIFNFVPCDRVVQRAYYFPSVWPVALLNFRVHYVLHVKVK